MGTIAEKLEYLSATKNDIQSAIEEKGVTVSSSATFRSYGDLIRSIDTSSGGSSGDSGGDSGETDPTETTDENLESLTITPTGRDVFLKPGYSLCEDLKGFADGTTYYEYDGSSYYKTHDTNSVEGKDYYIKNSSESTGYSDVTVYGDDNLTAENVKKDIIIYGVTGTYVGEENIPSPYDSYIEKAKEMYTGKYSGIFVAADDSYTNVIFMKDNFEIKSFNEQTSAYTYIGGVSVGGGSEWSVNDYSSTESSEGTFSKNIKYSSEYITYSSITLFPVGLEGIDDIIDTEVGSEIGAGPYIYYPYESSYFRIVKIEKES